MFPPSTTIVVYCDVGFWSSPLPARHMQALLIPDVCWLISWCVVPEGRCVCVLPADILSQRMLSSPQNLATTVSLRPHCPNFHQLCATLCHGFVRSGHSQTPTSCESPESPLQEFEEGQVPGLLWYDRNIVSVQFFLAWGFGSLSQNANLCDSDSTCHSPKQLTKYS